VYILFVCEGGGLIILVSCPKKLDNFFSPIILPGTVLENNFCPPPILSFNIFFPKYEIINFPILLIIIFSGHTYSTGD